VNEPSTSKENPAQANFESAFHRLEAILERMNSSAISLDESLKLFEEADKLINSCNKWLNDAERKVETLIKNRSGEVMLGPDQLPATQNFTLPK
jgi:exodeoxyribonuclease VII small subunit